MGESLYKRIMRAQKETAEATNWFQCIPAIVAVNEDPEHQHRIKVKIPFISESEIHDEWVRQMGGFAGSGGYGNFDVPSVGSPVMLFSTYGEGKELFYLAVYNEANRVPGDFENETERGVYVPGDYKILCGGKFYLFAACGIVIKTQFGTVEVDEVAGFIFQPKGEGDE